MALIKCSECGREISNKALSCPHCGNPMATTPQPTTVVQPVQKKEVFQVDESTFVLSEIVVLSEFGFRKWLSTFTVIVTLLICGIIGWESFAGKLSPNWLISGIGGMFIIGLVLLWFFRSKTDEIATTGDQTTFKSKFSYIGENYRQRIPKNQLVDYQGQDLINTSQFIINTDRVANYSFHNDYSLLLLAIIIDFVLLILAFILGEFSSTLLAIDIFLMIFTLIIGFKSARSKITIVGVGGKTLDVYTTIKDSKRIRAELEQKIRNLSI